ncbi:MAG: ATP-binding cassette domain-containing protein, partial [Neisseriaceae bacterium]|nr:ATP-binding cassette domain-containing protein [Neisseriaceae bacterium]
MICFESVSKTYANSIHALQNVSFSIQSGELIFVAGHSGAGKSTVLKLIAGIIKPTSGNILI